MSNVLLSYYLSQGLPHIGIGAEMKFNLKECNEWFASGWIQNKKL